jgi:hypothetical protein
MSVEKEIFASWQVILTTDLESRNNKLVAQPFDLVGYDIRNVCGERNFCIMAGHFNNRFGNKACLD